MEEAAPPNKTAKPLGPKNDWRSAGRNRNQEAETAGETEMEKGPKEHVGPQKETKGNYMQGKKWARKEKKTSDHSARGTRRQLH